MKLWNRIKKSSFLKNISLLISGTAIAQGLTILVAPLLTRLYTPDAFGVLALYVSIVGVVSVIMTMRYELAIVLPKNDRNAANLLILSLLFTFSITILLFMLIFLFGEALSGALETPELEPWLWLVPLSALLMGIYHTFNYWSTRRKHYKRLSISRVIRSVGMNTTQVTGGFAALGSNGLITGQVFGQFLASTALFLQVWREEKEIIKSSINFKRIKVLLRKYRDFPIFSASQALINALSQHATPLLLAFFFGPAVVGFYALAQRLIKMPATLVSNAVKQVYFQSAAALYNKTGKLSKQLLKSTFFLATVGILPSILIFVFAPTLFSWILGEDWYVAGQFSSWLVIWLFFGFMNKPAMATIQILRLQNILLIYEIALFISRVLALAVAAQISNALGGIIAYSLIGAVFNLLLIVGTCILVKIRENKTN